jgi:adenine-specific DNA-methyltransferase
LKVGDNTYHLRNLFTSQLKKLGIEDLENIDTAIVLKKLLGFRNYFKHYVNLSSLNDADFACTDEEKKLTKDFYQINK